MTSSAFVGGGVRRLGWLFLSLLVAAPAVAQTSGATPAWRPWRPVLGLGAGWRGADDLGRVTAESRSAATGTTTPAAFRLFDTTSALGAAPRAILTIGLPLTRALLVEVSGTVSRPTLTTTVSGDVEGAPDSDVTEPVDEYTLGGRLVLDLRRWTWAGRLTPFVAAGGAYLRQLHADQILVETGHEWSGGVGARYWLRPALAGRRGTLGATVEAGWTLRHGGITFVDGVRQMPSASVRVFAGF